jgi:hypothetical protein
MWFLLNSGYHPYPPFNVGWFLLFEVLTFMIETGIAYELGRRCVKDWTFLHAVAFSFCMNLVSAFLGLLVWSLFGVGV